MEDDRAGGRPGLAWVRPTVHGFRAKIETSRKLVCGRFLLLSSDFNGNTTSLTAVIDIFVFAKTFFVICNRSRDWRRIIDFEHACHGGSGFFYNHERLAEYKPSRG